MTRTKAGVVLAGGENYSIWTKVTNGRVSGWQNPNYVPPHGDHLYGIAVLPPNDEWWQITPRNAILRNFRVRIENPAGGGRAWVFRVRVNGVNSALIVTLNDPTVTGFDGVNQVNVNAGDRIGVTVQSVPNGAPLSRVHVCFELVPI